MQNTNTTNQPQEFTTEVAEKLNNQIVMRKWIAQRRASRVAKSKKQQKDGWILVRNRTIQDKKSESTPVSDFIGASDDGDIPIGIVRPTSKKVIKKRTVIPDTSALVRDFHEQICLGDFIVEKEKQRFALKARKERIWNDLDLKNLFAIVNEWDRITLMDNSLYLYDICRSLKFKDIHRLDIYLTKLYKLENCFHALDTALENFIILQPNSPIKNAKKVWRDNGKTLTYLEDHLDSHIAPRPLDVQEFEEQIKLYTDMIDATQSVTKVADKFTNFADVLQSDISKMTDSITSTSDSVHELSDKVNQVLDSSKLHVMCRPIQSVLDRMKEHNVVLASNFIALFSDIPLSTWLVHFTSILSMLGLNQYVMEKITMYMTSFSEQSKNTIKLLALISTFLGSYSPVNYILNASAFSVSREVKAICELQTLLEDVAKEWGILDSPEAELAKLLKEDMSKLIVNFGKYEAIFIERPGKFLFNKTYNEFKSDYQKLTDIRLKLINYSRGLETTTIIAEVTKLDNLYTKLKTNIEMTRRGSAVRQEPVALLFMGQSGIGKTELISRIASGSPNLESALTSEFKKRNYHNDKHWEDNYVPSWEIWNEGVNNKSDFADGYVGQDIHLVDDIFQKSDESDHLQWMNYISSQKCPTDQAALELKGLPYTCKLVMASLNKFPATSKQIKDISALHRRFMIVNVTLNGQKPDEETEYDPDFKHLSLELWNNGSDYMQKKVSEKVTINTLVDRIFYKIDCKYNKFCSKTGHTEQAGPETHPLSRSEFMNKTRKNKSVNIVNLTALDDWRTFSEKPNPFHFIIFNPSFVPECARLNEYCRVDPSFMEVSTVMDHFNDWSTHSSRALKEFCKYNTYFVSEHKGYLFTRENSQDKIFEIEDFHYQPQEDDEDTDTREEQEQQSWYEWVFNEPYWTKYNDVKTYVYNKLISVFPSFKMYIDMAISSLKNFYSFVKTFTVVEALVAWFTPVKDYLGLDFSYILRCVASTAISSLIGYIVVALYSKVSEMVTGSRLCADCHSESNTEVTNIVNELKDKYCKENCSLGYVYNNHSDFCKTLTSLTDKAIATLCNCQGDCSDGCAHANKQDFRSVAQLTKLIDSLEEEGSDNSRRAKKKSRINLESSDHSQNFKQKAKIVLEGSDNSQKLKKKARINLESSDQSQKMMKKTKLNFEINDRPVKAKVFSKPNDEHKRATLRRNIKDCLSSFGEEINVENLLNPILREEIQEDPMTYTVVDSVIPKFMVQCMRTDLEGNQSFLYGWGYKEYVITPAHLFAGYNYNYSFSRFNVQVPMTLVTHRVERDVALWKFSSGSSFSESLKNHLVTRKDIEEKFQGNRGGFIAVKRLSSTALLPASMIRVQNEVVRVRTENRTYQELIRVNNFKSTAIGTASGDCGAPLMMFNTSCAHKILGMHVIGGDQYSYASCLYWELIESMIEQDVTVEDDFDEEIFNPKEFIMPTNCIVHQTDYPVADIHDIVTTVSDNPTFVSKNDIEYIGNYQFNAVPASGTNIQEHRLAGTFPVTAIPAPLKESEVEDPSKLHLNGSGNPSILQTQINKYATEEPSVPGLESQLEDMVEQFANHMKVILQDEDLTPLTEEETLSGDPNDPDAKSMNLLTTPGEPFSRLVSSPGAKKNSYLKLKKDPETGRKSYIIDDSVHGQYLRESINKKEELAHKGIRTLSLWKNCLKDETRPIEKAKIGKTRLFTAAPFDTVYLGRKYFGKFKNAWQKHRNQLFHSVGINPQSTEWTELANLLLEKGCQFSDADFAAFDGRLRSDFMRAAGKIVIDVICEQCPENRQAMEVLWEEYIKTFHVSGHTIQLINHGNPSGNPMTTVVNCIVNFLYHWYAYICITGNTSLAHFMKHIGFTCFGDDVVFCSQEELTGYTFSEVAKIMRMLGQEYTTAQKDGIEKNARDISEITFLKRRFVKDGPFFLAPLDTDSIEQQFNYTNIGYNDIQTISTQIDEACFEAALHGSHYYRQFAKAMNTSLRHDRELYTDIGLLPNYTDVRATIWRRCTDVSVTSERK